MKQLIIIFISILICSQGFADIAPNPIIVKGIYTVDSCKIRMKTEFVYADLYNDSARVECTFELLNYGDSVTVQIGFPEMNFQYWSDGQYNENDKANFKISVNGKTLTEDQIGVPSELDSIYKAYMYVYFIDKEYNRKVDSIYRENNVIVKKNGTYQYPSTVSNNKTRFALGSLNKWRESKPYLTDLWSKFNKQMNLGNFPWYLWNVHFDKVERKIVKIIYTLPSGMGHGANYRYFKYLLNTGSGWYGVIEKADILLKLHDINHDNIEEITPIGYYVDSKNKTIEWKLVNIKPTDKDDIYIKYFNPTERSNWEKYQKKRKRRIRFRYLNPINWFR